MKEEKNEKMLAFDITRRQTTLSLLGLQKAGLSIETFIELAYNEALCQAMVEAAHKFRLFTPPEEQGPSLLDINEQVWRDVALTEQAIHELGDPPDLPNSDNEHLHCVTLFRDTEDPIKTLQENWAACLHIFGEKIRERRGLFQSSGLTLRQGARPRTPGLKWAICEMGRKFKGLSAEEAVSALEQKGYMPFGPELLAAAFMHPRWAMTINGKEMPYADAPDIEIVHEDGSKRIDSLCLGFDDKRSAPKLETRLKTLPFPSYGSAWFIVVNEVSPHLL